MTLQGSSYVVTEQNHSIPVSWKCNACFDKMWFKGLCLVTRLDCWTRLLDWTAGLDCVLDCWTGLLDWIIGLTFWTWLLHIIHLAMQAKSETVPLVWVLLIAIFYCFSRWLLDGCQITILRLIKEFVNSPAETLKHRTNAVGSATACVKHWYQW